MPVPAITTRQAVLHYVRDKLRSWTKPIFTCGMGIITPWKLPRAWGRSTAAACCAVARYHKTGGLQHAGGEQEAWGGLSRD